MKLSERICHLFRHRWQYYIVLDFPQRIFRFCRRCGIAQEYKRILQHRCWVTLVQSTAKGAEDWAVINYPPPGVQNKW